MVKEFISEVNRIYLESFRCLVQVFAKYFLERSNNECYMSTNLFSFLTLEKTSGSSLDHAVMVFKCNRMKSGSGLIMSWCKDTKTIFVSV